MGETRRKEGGKEREGEVGRGRCRGGVELGEDEREDRVSDVKIL